MGNSESPNKINHGIQEFIIEEYNKVKKDKKDHLTISEVLLAKQPEGYPFSFQHIGVLYVCDKDHDSIFTLNDFYHLGLWIQHRLQGVQLYEFRAQLQAEAMDSFIQDLLKPDGQTQAQKWLVDMLVKDSQTVKLHNVEYVRIEQFKIIYQIFSIHMMSDIDIQTFFNMVRRASEESGMPVHQVMEQDDLQQYIALPVCARFVGGFLKGVTKIIHEIGYDTENI